MIGDLEKLPPIYVPCEHCEGTGDEPHTDNDVSGPAACRKCTGERYVKLDLAPFALPEDDATPEIDAIAQRFPAGRPVDLNDDESIEQFNDLLHKGRALERQRNALQKELEGESTVNRRQHHSAQESIEALDSEIEMLEAKLAERDKELEHWKHCHGVTADKLAEREAEIERLRKSLEPIARQRLPTEVPEDERKDGDYEGAYDCIVRGVRAAIDAKEAES